MRSACSLPAVDACRGGREEAVSIQLGQPYSGGIRHRIQPLPGQARGGWEEPAPPTEGELEAYAVGLPPLPGHPISSSGQKAPGSGRSHLHYGNSLRWKS